MTTTFDPKTDAEPCSLCSGYAQHITNDAGQHRLQCRRCQWTEATASPPAWHNTLTEAIKAWNDAHGD